MKTLPPILSYQKRNLFPCWHDKVYLFFLMNTVRFCVPIYNLLAALLTPLQHLFVLIYMLLMAKMKINIVETFQGFPPSLFHFMWVFCCFHTKINLWGFLDWDFHRTISSFWGGACIHFCWRSKIWDLRQRTWRIAQEIASASFPPLDGGVGLYWVNGEPVVHLSEAICWKWPAALFAPHSPPPLKKTTTQ